ELAPYYALLLNDAEVADAVIEKDRFQALAVARGLPIPRTLAWEELEGFGRPALLAEPAAEPLRQQLMIQEYIAGDDRQIWSFHGFCDEAGELIDWFIGRK